MIHNSKFQADQDQQEILPIDSQEFPYVCNYAELDNSFDRRIPWHWHSYIEMDYIAEGEIELQTPDSSVCLPQGSMIFINTDVMHDIRAKDHQKGCKIYAHIFHINFLGGIYNSLLEQKYLLPIVKNPALPFCRILPDSYEHIQMISKFLRIVELNREEPFGYEFEVRFRLSEIWCFLLKETRDFHPTKLSENLNDVARLKAMMEFVQRHYMEKISVENIADAASISVRECSRCFQRCTRMTPNHYLNDYRLRMAAGQLIQTNDSILNISENCGFSSSSYFGKAFYNAMGCTPKEYRKKKRLTE